MARVPYRELFWASALGLACESGHSASRGQHAQSSIGNRATAPDAAASFAPTPPSSITPHRSRAARSNCGLETPKRIEIWPALHGKVVIQNQLGAVKRTTAPRLINEPDDHAEYYLAETEVDPTSLPGRLRALRSAPLGVLTGPSDCRPRLGKVSAWAWADEQGRGWNPASPRYNAARAFRAGNSFLVAELEPPCDDLRGALLTPDDVARYRSWQTRSLEVEREPAQRDPAQREPAREAERRALVAKGLAALEREPGLAVQNTAYESFAKQSGVTLPKRWWELPRSHVRWSYATLEEASLLIVSLSGMAQHGASTFLGAWVGIWCVEADGSLVSLGPDSIPAGHIDAVAFLRHELEIIGAPRSLPLVFYANFALDPSSGRYDHRDYGVGPAPLIEDPTPPSRPQP